MLTVMSLVLALTASAANVTGKWEGTLKSQRQDGTPSEDSVLLILEQKDTTITGSVGGREDDQHPITKGTIDGDKVIIDARTESGREYHLELRAAGDEMTGTVTSGTRKGELHVKKRKE